MWIKYLAYGVFITSIFSLWIPVKSKVKPWVILFGLSLILAFVSHIANLIAILSILLFYALVAMYNKCSSKLKNLLWVVAFFLGLALELHLIPGFKNLLIWNKIQFTPDAIPFTLYLNFDKTIVGLIILGLTLNLASTPIEWKALLKQAALKLPIIIFMILILSIVFDYTKFEPKLPHDLWIWVISNLLFTCVAEEGLFRGFFQEPLSQLKYKCSNYVAILAPTTFFGIIHYPGGIKYVILATVAGALYGWVYKITKRIEASILTHFFLNLTHILLFTYPALLN
ncbi:MAG: protease family protein [Pseudomonadota bacterium]|nr:protease family protein [Pseudomonadota bacterium]